MYEYEYWWNNPDEGGGGYTPPTPVAGSGDWAKIADLVAGHTDYRNVTFSSQVPAGTLNLNGTYTILAVAAHQITLSNPDVENPDWDNLDGSTAYSNASISTSGMRWVGPFTVDLPGLNQLLLNFTALAGLYRITKKNKQLAETVGIQIELTPVDEDDNPIGPAEYFATSMTGSAEDKDSIGVTYRATPSFTGRCQVRVRRTTSTDPDYEGTIVDEIKWRDAYGLAPVDLDHFGNVTTVHTRTYATSGATSIKERKLNALVTRKIPLRLDGTNFTPDLHATNRIDEIIACVSRDNHIGNRGNSELDFDNIYDVVAEVEAHFNSEEAVEFGYTFDDDNTSFEETITAIAAVAFCRPYRQGAVIRLAFERARDSAVLLFNHRNILPRTQERAVSFGVIDDHDGVELEWREWEDGAPLTYNIPSDRSAVAPRKLEVIGVIHENQAFWHAWRAWNKLQWQSVALEQECTQEAALVLPSDRIIITDQTRPAGFEGEVREVAGLHLQLSQPVEFVPDVDHTIYLQHVDQTVEAISVTARAGLDPDDPDTPYWVTLGTAPATALSVLAELSVLPTYVLVPANDIRPRAFLVTEREPNSNFTETLRAINYSFLYYQMDELLFWLPIFDFTLYDEGPFHHPLDPGGAGVVAFDEGRNKGVYDPGAGGNIDVEELEAPESYTKCAWVKGEDDSVNLLFNAEEAFGYVDGVMAVTHGGSSVTAPVPDAAWRFWAVTYDASDGATALYQDGFLVGAGDLDARDLDLLNAVDAITGRVDEVRLYKRVLTPREIMDIYLSTKRPGEASLALESGEILMTEGGEELMLESGETLTGP